MTLPGLPANTPSASSPFSTNTHTERQPVRPSPEYRTPPNSVLLVYRLAVILKGTVSEAEGAFKHGCARLKTHLTHLLEPKASSALSSHY